MQAVVKFGDHDGDVELRDIPEPGKIARRQVLLKVKAAGVCGSDIHMWRNNQSWPLKLPLVLGHEFCGVVAEAGEDTSFKPGDRVVCETAAQVCGQCVYCKTGNYNLCPQRKGYGALIDGAFTDYVVARPEILHHIPDNVPFEHAALVEPICVAYNALVEKTLIKPGDSVIIQGPGPIGIMALMITKLRGAYPLIVLGMDADEHRLEVAAMLGADMCINIQRENPVQRVKALGDGFGVDMVVDCTGVSKALQQAMEMVRPNGRICKIGWGPEPLNFSLDPLVAKAVTLQGSFSHTYTTWERAIGLLASGQIDLKPVIGGVYSLHDWREAFARMEEGMNVKSVLVTN